MQEITPNLWFDKEAKKAAKFYTSFFKDSKIKDTATLHNAPSGTVDIVTIELLGQEFTLYSPEIFDFIELVENGYLNQILISHDSMTNDMMISNGGPGYVHIPKVVVPLMRMEGLSEEQIHAITVDNPARVLSIV